MIKKSIKQKDIKIINMYVFKIRVSKYKTKLIAPKKGKLRAKNPANTRDMGSIPAQRRSTKPMHPNC